MIKSKTASPKAPVEETPLPELVLDEAAFLGTDTPVQSTAQAQTPDPEEGEWEPDFRVVDIGDVSPNDYNPNDMEAEYFEALVEAVKQEGMNQPVLVREDPANPGKFLIVDGENRYQAVKFLGKPRLPVVVVPLTESMAKIRTLSYNQLRGSNIPIKLARLLVDLHKEFTPKEVRAMTGLVEDDQTSVMELLKVPDFNPSDGIKISPQDVDRPIGVNLMLMPDEHGAYTTAMKRAMKIAGDDVVALVGNEVTHYDQAMKATMGIAGVKLRNVAMALICQTFNSLSKEKQEELVKAAHTIIYDKLSKDAQVKEAKKAKSDKVVPA